MKEQYHISFNHYIETFNENAGHARRIVSMLMIASFIALLGLFNSLRPGLNWLGSRLASADNAYIWVRFDEDSSREKIIVPGYNGNRPVLNSFTFSDLRNMARSVGEIKSALNDDDTIVGNFTVRFPSKYLDRDTGTTHRDTLRAGFGNEMEAAFHVLRKLRVTSRHEFDWMLTNLRKAIVDSSILIEIPILGISFDVNNLAIIGALAFSILYFLLVFYLSRERKNLKLVFEMVKTFNVSKIRAYQLVSMRQVLTIPGSIDEYLESKEPLQLNLEEKNMNRYSFLHNTFWSSFFITSLPIFIPAIIWMIIFTYDLSTHDIGQAISSSLTRLHTFLSLLVGVCMLLLCRRAISQQIAIARFWNVQRELIIKEIIAGNTPGEAGKT